MPGGGSEAGESPEQTVIREAREELAREISIHRRIGQATQFFYAGDLDCWFQMDAVFLSAKLGSDTGTRPEHQLHWEIPTQIEFFHDCHHWAATLEGPVDSTVQPESAA